MAEDAGCGAPCPGGTIASVSVAPTVAGLAVL